MSVFFFDLHTLPKWNHDVNFDRTDFFERNKDFFINIKSKSKNKHAKIYFNKWVSELLLVYLILIETLILYHVHRSTLYMYKNTPRLNGRTWMNINEWATFSTTSAILSLEWNWHIIKIHYQYCSVHKILPRKLKPTKA